MMFRTPYLLMLGCMMNALQPAAAGLRFGQLQDLFRYADSASIALHNADLNRLQAQRAKLAAIFAVPDPQSNWSGSFIDNTRLPVNLFPADAFGGQPGTYREVQTGVRYNTGFSQSLDVKLLNPQGWSNLKLAAINLEISTTDRQATRKSLYENIASAYFNLLQLQEQYLVSVRTAAAADSLLTIAQTRYGAGVVKQQDVNDSRVNAITLHENANQIDFLIRQQCRALKVLIDVPEADSVIVAGSLDSASSMPVQAVERNDLALRSAELKAGYALAGRQQAGRDFYPTLSLVGSNAYNQYNQDFTVFGGSWINSQYIGLKLNLVIPNAASIANRVSAKFNYRMALNNLAQARIKARSDQAQLETDRSKAASQLRSYSEILAIQRDTYFRNKLLYGEGLLALDRTLNSFTAMLNAAYNQAAAKAAVALANARIEINNSIR